MRMPITLATLFIGTLFAQDVAFDAASVKVHAEADGRTSITQNHGTYRMSGADLQSCITRAYGVADPQVVGPAWIATEKYDIAAKAPLGTPESQLPVMLQKLLAERFGLVVHRETQERPVFALVVGKNGPKMQRDDEGHAKGGMESSPGRASGHSITMVRLATFLSSPRAGLGVPVIDKTGLDGFYTFTLLWTPDSAKESNLDGPPSITVALQEQLGLKLESRKGPVEMLVVDHAERVPTEN